MDRVIYSNILLYIFRFFVGSSFSPATPGPCGMIPGLVDMTPDVGITTLGVEAYTPMSALSHPHNTSNMGGYQEGR